jgi:hypothetical protein
MRGCVLQRIRATCYLLRGTVTRMSEIREIGTFVIKPDGTAAEMRDFAPLLMPTNRLLERISSEGGPTIPSASLFGEVVSIPLLTINKTYGLSVRLAIESSAVAEHASALRTLRTAEVQNLFGRFFAAPQEHREALVARTETSAAALLVAKIIAAQVGLAAGQSGIERTPHYEVRAVWLRDTNRTQ